MNNGLRKGPMKGGAPAEQAKDFNERVLRFLKS